MNLQQLLGIVRELARAWSADGISRLSAALAYFAVFSLAPLLIIVIQIAAFVLGAGRAGGHHAAARAAIFSWLQHSLGASATAVVAQIVDSMLRQPGQGLFAAAIGWMLLIFGALGLVGALRDALDIVWHVQPPETGLLGALRARALSLAFVVVTAFFLIATVIVNTALLGFAGSELLATLVSFAACVLLFALLFKLFPAAKVGWRDALAGAAATTVLFEVGQLALSWYLNRASTASVYGAAGSLVLILLWIYYTAQTVLIGAEFTKALGERSTSTVAGAGAIAG